MAKLRGAAVLGLSAVAAGVYWGFRFASSSYVRPYLGDAILWKEDTEDPVVALTFDDGPHPMYTERFLAALEGHQATFFVLGESVERWPHLARALVQAGHEVACHGFTHRTMTRAAPWTTIWELRMAHETIGRATGAPPRFYRPPYGRFNMASWFEAPRLGMRRTLWSAGARDWDLESTPDLITSRILEAAEPGAILILHDAAGDPGAPENTLAALPAILDGFRERGLEMVTLSQLASGNAQPSR